MSTFSDQMLLKSLNDAFTQDILVNQLTLAALFNSTYTSESFEIQELTFGSLDRRTLESPSVEPIRITGSDERISPTSERRQIDRSMKRLGRLVWVDAILEVTLNAKVHVTAMPIDSITVQKLLDVLGGAADIADLKAKLLARYSQSVVDATFRDLHITSIEDFRSRGDLLVQFLFKAPAPFDPGDPANARTFPLTVCLKFQSDLKVTEALQDAKLTREVLQQERDSSPSMDDAEVTQPFVFVTLFPDGVAVDNAIPGLTAAQIKDGVQKLFVAEGMLAHFIV